MVDSVSGAKCLKIDLLLDLFCNVTRFVGANLLWWRGLLVEPDRNEVVASASRLVSKRNPARANEKKSEFHRNGE